MAPIRHNKSMSASDDEQGINKLRPYESNKVQIFSKLRTSEQSETHPVLLGLRERATL